MPEPDLRWYHLSVCQNMDLNNFYDNYEDDPVFAANMDSICISCPVRAICRREGEDNRETGLWGGVYLDKGKIDVPRNAHKTDDIWEIVNEY